MAQGIFIFVDDDFRDPIYADPAPEEIDADVWTGVREIIVEALEGDRDARGTEELEGHRVGWRTAVKIGLSFVAVCSEDVSAARLEQYLQEVATHYRGEVDDLRRPERAGVADVVVEVIPPWEDESFE